MPSIRSVGTALPHNRYSFEDVRAVGADWLKDCPDKLELFERFLKSSKAEQRFYVLSAEELLALNGMQNRQHYFEHFGPQMGEAALRQALQLGGLQASDTTGLVFTSCSCPSIPAIDALIIERSGLERTISRFPIYQHGCAGGVIGLQLGAELSKLKGQIAVTSVELCSLVFQPGNLTPAQLVGSAIFADGAAAALIVPEENGLVIRGGESFLVPNSRHLMGYDILDDGFHLRLDRELPRALAQVAPERVEQFLLHYNLKPNEISHWLFHPGGIKILDFLEATFSLRSEQARWSREILSQIGNLSSATILFVLRAFLDSRVSKPGDRILMLGVGPGLTIELVLFEWLPQ